MSFLDKLSGFLPGAHNNVRPGSEPADHTMKGWGPVTFNQEPFGRVQRADIPTRVMPAGLHANDRSKRSPQMFNGFPDMPSAAFYSPYAMAFLRSNQFNLKQKNVLVGGSVPIAVGPVQIQQLRSMTYQNMPRYGIGPGMLFPPVNPSELA